MHGGYIHIASLGGDVQVESEFNRTSNLLNVSIDDGSRASTWLNRDEAVMLRDAINQFLEDEET